MLQWGRLRVSLADSSSPYYANSREYEAFIWGLQVYLLVIGEEYLQW